MDDFEDNFTEVDPAADFLAREQNELAGLEDDLNFATYTQTNEEPVKEKSVQESPPKESTVPADVTSTLVVKSEREEPEKIKKWRKEKKPI